MMDGAKMKGDILQLFKINSGFVSAEDIAGLKEELRKVRSEMADCTYDVTACKDAVQKNEKEIVQNAKQNSTDFGLIRNRLDALDNAVAGLKKKIGMLDDKNKESKKSEALKSNPGLAT